VVDSWNRIVPFGSVILDWFGYSAIILVILVLIALIVKRSMNLSIACKITKNGVPPSATVIPRGTEKILVMDDDSLMLESLHNVLTGLGYQVICLGSGEKAVAYMENNCADLVLLDMLTDQGIDGTETYRRIRAIRPMQKAIMLSGYADPKNVSGIRNLGVETYLVKPVSVLLLATAIRAELDRP